MPSRVIQGFFCERAASLGFSMGAAQGCLILAGPTSRWSPATGVRRPFRGAHVEWCPVSLRG
jgi:hypothetical protein